MDIATLLGIVAGFILIAGSIALGGSLPSFGNFPSALIVLGGTLSATLIMERMENVIGAFKIARNVFLRRGADVTETISTILRLSNVARRNGVLGLENEDVDDPFLARGLRMVVDNVAREEIRDTLTAELVSMRQRHMRGQKLFKFMGSTAPAMGMIGTLIGLVQMLQKLDNPSAIGPAMAVALLTTLYGAILAYLVFNPIAEKLQRRTHEEIANMLVVIEGIDGIARGYNSSLMREKLEAHLAPNQRTADPREAA